MVTVKQRFIHSGARKLRLVADSIRGKSFAQAHATLTVAPQAASRTLLAILKSAESAARQGKLEGDLAVAAIYVDEGPAIKRRFLGSRGRSYKMEHRMSHVTLTVGQAAAKTKKTPKKA